MNLASSVASAAMAATAATAASTVSAVLRPNITLIPDAGSEFTTPDEVLDSLVSAGGGDGIAQEHMGFHTTGLPGFDDSVFPGGENVTFFPGGGGGHFGVGFDDGGLPGGGGGGFVSMQDLLNQKVACGHYVSIDDKLHLSMDAAEGCVFWTQGVASAVVAAFGLLGNAISIWILSVPEMRGANAFNRLLLSLAIIDCLFIVPGVFVYAARAFNWRPDAYNYAFPVFLYPFSEVALCSSIYMTVAIAVERYIGLCRPMQRLSGRGPYSAKCYIFPVLLLATLINIPKFLESETVEDRDPSSNGTTSRVRVTELRTDPSYITYYTMWTRLLATGVIPLVVLALLNSKIYLSIRHSKQQLRILAIRSALPMAILGQSAPSVPPLSDLISGRGASTTEGDSGHPPSPKSPETARTGGGDRRGSSNGSPSVHVRSNRPPLQRSDGRDGHDANMNGSPKTSSSYQPGKNGYSAIAPPGPGSSAPKAVATSNQQQAGAAGSPSASPSATTPSGRRFVNGQLRQIQRSVSAFEPTLKRTLRLKDAHILRSNSTTVAGAAASNMNPSANVIALTSQWQQSAAPGGAAVASADIKLAPILFGVVIVFVLCNSLRVVLNVYDFSVVDEIIDCNRMGHSRYPPTWVMCSISVSHLLLMVNSSVNFLVYCVAGTRFRRILFRKLRVLAKAAMDFGCCRGKKDSGSNNVSSGTRETNDRLANRPNQQRGAAEARCSKPRNNAVLTADFLAQKKNDAVLTEEEEEEDGEQAGPAAGLVKGRDLGGGGQSIRDSIQRWCGKKEETPI